MKKASIIMAFLLFAFLTPVLAQQEAQKIAPKEHQVYLGISGNVNSTWIIYQQTYGDYFLDYKFTIHPGVNLQVGYDWDYFWGIRGEVGYAWMGQKYDGTRQGMPASRNIKLNYVQIPLLFKFRAPGKTVKFYAMTGFQVNFLISAKQEYLVDGKKPDPFYYERQNRIIDVGQEDIKDRFTNANLGYRFDLGVDILLSEKLFLNAGFSSMYSITNLTDPDWRMYDYNGEYHLSHNLYTGLNIGINYIF